MNFASAITGVGYRPFTTQSGRSVFGLGAQCRYGIGDDAYMMYCAMWGQSFQCETGQTSDDLAAVALAKPLYAEQNERAFRRKPLDLATYLDSPYVVDPYRSDDCTVEV